jgi:hypothetical protein
MASTQTSAAGVYISPQMALSAAIDGATCAPTDDTQISEAGMDLISQLNSVGFIEGI